MRKVLTVLLLLAALPAFSNIPSILPPITNGNCATWANSATLGDAGIPCGGAVANSTYPSVAVVATSNVTLSGVQTVDGATGTAGQTLVLATAQSTASQNGPWIMQTGAWTRPAWYPSGGTTQAVQFATTFVRLGTVYQGSVWRQTAAAPITIGTTATTWAITPVALNTHTVGGTGLPLANLAPQASGTILAAPTVTIASVAITGTAGQFSFVGSGLAIGQYITISGTLGGTGSITGYTNPTTYYVSATNGTSTFTLQTATQAAIVTTAGTLTGLTYSSTAAPGAQSALTGGILDNVFYQKLLGSGAKFDDSTDDGPAWNTALATCTLAARCQIYLPPGLTSKINTGITITSGVQSFNGNGLTLDASGMTTGCISVGSGCYAMAIIPASGTVGGYFSNEFSNQLPIENFRLLGPNSTSSTVDGIGIVGGSNAVSTQTFRNFMVRGFRDGYAVGNNVYIVSNYAGYITGNWRSGVTLYGTTLSGENINFHGGNISGNNSAAAITFTGSISANATSATLNANWTLPSGVKLTCFSDGEVIPVTYTNGATTATFATAISNGVTSSASTVAAGIWLQNTESGSKELGLHSVSDDYNDVNVVNLGGELDGFGSHSEDNHYQFPMMVDVQNSGSQSTCIKWYGGSISPTESTPRATALINLSAGFTKGCFIASTRFNVASTGDLIFNVIVGTPFINISGSTVDFFGTTATNYPDIGAPLQMLFNPGFELNATTGWTINGSNDTITVVTSPVQSGTYAAQIVCASPGWAGAFLQTVGGLHPGQQVEYVAWVNVTAYTSGTLNFNINFQSFGAAVVKNTTVTSWSGTTGGYVPVHGYFTVPQSGAIVYPEFFGTAFIGTFVVDSFEIYAQ